MNNEAVFFNPGDAIANDFDYQAARRSAEIYKIDHAVTEGLVVAKGDDEQFAVFYETARVSDPARSPATKPVGKYTILAHL